MNRSNNFSEASPLGCGLSGKVSWYSLVAIKQFPLLKNELHFLNNALSYIRIENCEKTFKHKL